MDASSRSLPFSQQPELDHELDVVINLHQLAVEMDYTQARWFQGLSAAIPFFFGLILGDYLVGGTWERLGDTFTSIYLYFLALRFSSVPAKLKAIHIQTQNMSHHHLLHYIIYRTSL